MRHRRPVIVLTCLLLGVATLVAPAAFAASARHGLDLCTLIPRTTIEDRIGTPLGDPHNFGTDPLAAGCHFPAKAIGGTDVGHYASTNAPRGIKHSYEGSFFATLDTFQRVYGTPTPVTGIGTAAYVAFAKRGLAQGALLVQQGPQRAVLVVLVGQYVTPKNTVTRAGALARLLLKARQLRAST
jgi:hypothetical protein